MPHTQPDLVQVYKHKLMELVKPENGAHFNAASVSTEQLESFRVDDTAVDMARIAPFLEDLLDILLATTDIAEEGLGEDEEYCDMNILEDLDELKQVILNATPGDRDCNMKKHQNDQKSAIIVIVSLTDPLQLKAHISFVEKSHYTEHCHTKLEQKSECFAKCYWCFSLVKQDT